MWCSVCQSDVATEVGPDNRRVTCSNCGHLLGGIGGAEPNSANRSPSPESGRDEAAQDESVRHESARHESARAEEARQLLDRWARSHSFDPYGPPKKSPPKKSVLDQDAGQPAGGSATAPPGLPEPPARTPSSQARPPQDDRAAGSQSEAESRPDRATACVDQRSESPSHDVSHDPASSAADGSDVFPHGRSTERTGADELDRLTSEIMDRVSRLTQARQAALQDRHPGDSSGQAAADDTRPEQSGGESDDWSPSSRRAPAGGEPVQGPAITDEPFRADEAFREGGFHQPPGDETPLRGAADEAGAQGGSASKRFRFDHGHEQLSTGHLGAEPPAARSPESRPNRSAWPQDSEQDHPPQPARQAPFEHRSDRSDQSQRRTPHFRSSNTKSPDTGGAEEFADQHTEQPSPQVDSFQPDPAKAFPSAPASGGSGERRKQPEPASDGQSVQSVEPTPADGGSSSWYTGLGQMLAYLGIIALTAGTSGVVVSYFGGPAQYAPYGWLLATIGQMLLFLGIVTLISAGMDETAREMRLVVNERMDEVNRRLDAFDDSILRLDQSHQEGPPRPHLLSHADRQKRGSEVSRRNRSE